DRVAPDRSADGARARLERPRAFPRGSVALPLVRARRHHLHPGGFFRGDVGLVQTAVYLSATWSALVGGRLADRVGERSVLIVSGVITGVGATAAAFAGPFWAFLVAAFILGLGTGVQNPAGSAAVMRWFPPRR